MGIKATAGTLMELINRIAPFSLAEEWDNSGLQAGDLSWPVKKVMIALDVSEDVMESAEKWGADLVLTHHPLMFRPIKCIDFGTVQGKIILRAALCKISIISAHTNFDKADKGLNDFFADLIGLSDIVNLYEDEKISDKKDQGIYPGIGRQGKLVSPMNLASFAVQIKDRLGIKNLRVTGDENLPIKKAAVCTGSGGSLLDVFFKSGADVFVTGDIKYHEARDIEQAGLGLIDVGHFSSEHIGVDLLAERLDSYATDSGIDIEIRKFKSDRDPFRII